MRANSPQQIQLQRILFDRYGLLYERKRGEFEDGIRQNYIGRSQVIQRDLFYRLLLAANGAIRIAAQKKPFVQAAKGGGNVPNLAELDRFYFAFQCYLVILRSIGKKDTAKDRELYGKVYAMTELYMPAKVPDFPQVAAASFDDFRPKWDAFRSDRQADGRYIKVKIDPNTMERVPVFREGKWYRSGAFQEDVMACFHPKATTE
jgi:hypothetical protein